MSVTGHHGVAIVIRVAVVLVMASMVVSYQFEKYSISHTMLIKVCPCGCCRCK